MTNWIVCPVRNGLPLTRAAMKDFLAQDIGDIAVLLLDNGSTDGTAQWAATLGPQVHTSRATNRGVAASWNAGLRWVFGQKELTSRYRKSTLLEGLYEAGDPLDRIETVEESPEYCLVVNNDVRLRPYTYRHLVSHGGGFVTAVGSDDVKCIEWPYNESVPPAVRPHPDFSCFVIRREVFDSVGPFNELYTDAYAEDAEYHLRMHNAGVKACCVDLPFWHLGAGTLKYASEDEADAIRIAADANREQFHEAHGVRVGSKEYYALFGHDAPTQDGGALP